MDNNSSLSSLKCKYKPELKRLSKIVKAKKYENQIDPIIKNHKYIVLANRFATR